jgi:short-subunit dehydrogenase
MKDQGGFIVNVMSTAATMARAQECIYCAAKWGARGFTESLRLEAKKTPVKIVSVYPGGMKTPFWSERAGMQPNTSAFMEPSEVAGVIVDNVLDKSSLYVADMVINRI